MAMIHVCKLLCVPAVWIDSGVSAKGNLDAGLDSAPKIFSLQVANFLFLLNELFRVAEAREFSDDEIVIVNICHQISAMLLHQLNAFIIKQAPVLDGNNASAWPTAVIRSPSIRITAFFILNFLFE
jgi:hypothetical protein